jgi:hypothetical protein
MLHDQFFIRLKMLEINLEMSDTDTDLLGRIEISTKP